jgi:hypothetical protein
MKKIFVVIIILIFSLGSLSAQEITINSNLLKDIKIDSKYQKKLELQNKILYSKSRFSRKDSIDINNSEQVNNPNLKSTFLGGLFSGIIPGAGQFYAKSYIKSAAFLAAEVGLWVAYGIFQKKGNDQTSYYQDYANKNWDMRKYGQWLKDQGYTKSGDIDLSSPDNVLRAQINACEEINFSHTLPPWGEQQYYEVIGKYQNFLSGWSTATSAITKNNYLDYKLPQVDQYMTDRQQANTYYNRGTTMITVVIINHLLSAADGVWSVMRYNSKFINVKSSVDVQGHYSYNQQRTVIVPHLNLSISF